MLALEQSTEKLTFQPRPLRPTPPLHGYGAGCSQWQWIIFMCQSGSHSRTQNCTVWPVFTARRVCIARTTPWHDVRPSVHPSVTRQYSVETITYVLKICSPSGSPTVLVFPYQTGWQYSDGNPPNGGVECKGIWENHDFRPISRFISGTMQDRAIVTMEGEYGTGPKVSNGTSLYDLERPLTQISRSLYYSTSNNPKKVQDRAIQGGSN